MTTGRDPRDILNFEQPLDVEFFDTLVRRFYEEGSKEIHDVLASFQKHPLAWKCCPSIFENSHSENSKIIALNTLKECVETQWKVLPPQQQHGMKAFLEELILRVSKDNTSDMTGAYVTKLNEVLIGIVKREWPHNWPNFVSRVVGAAKKSEAVCINNVRLLRLLSEEAFGNISDLTHTAQSELRKNLHREFNTVFELCMAVLKDAKNPVLIVETLKTLAQFLKLRWIPMEVVFNSPLLEGLAFKFYGTPIFKSYSLECMVEVAQTDSKEMEGSEAWAKKITQMFMKVLQTTVEKYQVNQKRNFEAEMDRSEQERAFIQHLANFIASMLMYHKHALENLSDRSRSALVAALQVLLRFTDLDDETIFAICVEYWSRLATDLEKTIPKQEHSNPFEINSSGKWGTPGGSPGRSRYNVDHPRYQLYRPVLHQLKFILMQRLPRPKEVLVVQDDYGNAVKVEAKDTLSLNLHKTISRTLWVLSRIDPSDSREVIAEKLDNIERNLHQINFVALQSLCWSIGAVAGSMTDGDEKTFLVTVIKILLQLCEAQRTKDAKAIIAACIMYVVRKYPKFLRKHWRFLQTVVRKLVEFLHETHPGVQDMSVETLQEIASKTGEKFLAVQKDDNEPFWNELMRGMREDMCEALNDEQKEALFRTWGTAIARQPARDKVQDAPKFIGMLLHRPNEMWQDIIGAAKQSKEVLEEQQTVATLIHLLRIYRETAHSVGGPFIIQMSRIFDDMMVLYEFYAQTVSREIAENPNRLSHPRVRAMRTVKSECLQLFGKFVAKSAQSDEEKIVRNFVPKFLRCVLTDYEKCAPRVREAACINACCALIDRFGRSMGQFVQQIFKCTFQITLDMLKGSLQTMPDLRESFFRLLYTVAHRCFQVFRSMNPDQLRLIIQCVMWGVEHLDGNVSETSVRAMEAFLSQVREDRMIATSFYRQFVHGVVEKLLAVLTDNLHKQSFPLCCELLRQICVDVCDERVCERLGEEASNEEFVGQRMSSVLEQRFPNLTSEVVKTFVVGCFRIASETRESKIRVTIAQRNGEELHPFLKHCHDLLVFIKQVHHRVSG